jgi:hypothetical protein
MNNLKTIVIKIIGTKPLVINKSIISEKEARAHRKWKKQRYAELGWEYRIF